MPSTRYSLTKRFVDKRWPPALSLMFSYFWVFSYAILQRIHRPKIKLITTKRWTSRIPSSCWLISCYIVVWLPTVLVLGYLLNYYFYQANLILTKAFFHISVWSFLAIFFKWMTSQYPSHIRSVYRKWQIHCHCLSCLMPRISSLCWVHIRKT